VSVGNVGGVVQVPGIGRAETSGTECLDHGVEVSGRP
jgi:hypothetical protein